MSVCGSIYMDLSGVQLKVELQQETPDVTSTCVDGASNEVEFLDPTIAVAAEFSKMYIQSPDNHGCNASFVLSVIEEVVYENPCKAVNSVSGVGVL